ncbi:hypothetical protein ACFQ36_15695 [Arthrobacter sp. GCM10027362]
MTETTVHLLPLVSAASGCPCCASAGNAPQLAEPDVQSAAGYRFDES